MWNSYHSVVCFNFVNHCCGCLVKDRRISTLRTLVPETEICYVCLKRIPINEMDGHLLEHIPTDEKPTEQAVCQIDFPFIVVACVRLFFHNLVSGVFEFPPHCACMDIT